MLPMAAGPPRFTFTALAVMVSLALPCAGATAQEMLPAPPEAAAPRQATPPPPNGELPAIAVFALAEKASAAGRIDEAAALYDALTHDRSADVRAEARFRKGMMLADAKRYRAAAEAFRALLDEKPDAARVRLELARVLAAMGEEGAARRALRQAQASGLPPEVARTVGQFDAALRSQKRAGLNIELALAPDTNINRATQVRTLDTVIAPLILSRDARAQSGVGAHVSADGYFKVPVAPGLTLVPRVSTLDTLYRKREFDDISASALVGLEWQRSRDRISPSIGRSWRWYGNHPYLNSNVVALDWIHVLGKRAQLVVSGSAASTDYLRNDLQDGANYALNVSVERALSSRMGVSMTLIANRQTARDPGYSTASGGGRLLAWREAGRTTLFASAMLQRTEGDAALALFGERRREWYVNARAGATLRRFTVHGFAPYVRISYERNWSTIALYDYRRLTSEIGITRAL